MEQHITDPVSALNKAAPDIISRFVFERTTTVVGRSDFGNTPPEDGSDADIHDGTIATTHGYARLARHRPTGAICLITSKASINLRGVREKGGAIRATEDGLNKSYIAAAYRTSGKDKDVYTVAPKLRRALSRFGENLGERSDKHFTLYGASFSNAEPSSFFNSDTPTEVYTNGRLAYLIDKTKTGYKVTFYAPTKREGGGFVPIKIGKRSLSDTFASISKTIAVTDTYEDARHKMSEHWQKMSSKLWDEKSIFEGEGFTFQAKKSLATVFNHAVEHGFQLALVTSAIGLGMGLVNPKYGLVTGLFAAVTHTVAHHVLDESYLSTTNAMKKAKLAKKRLNIDAYNFGQDVSDHFKIQTAENISKLSAKMDLKRFHAGDFEFLTAEQSCMLLDHEQPMEGFRPSSLRAHLISVHQRGFSSSCTLPDKRTRLDVFQSGLVRLLHEKDDGKIVMYCRYRPDTCTDENLRLPLDKQEQMGTGILRFEYDRRRPVFHHAFKQTTQEVTMEEMMEDIRYNLLFKGDKTTSVAIKAKSYQSIEETFSTPEEMPERYMSGKPPVPPELTAIL